jgi:predicted small lipoprotein YifL
MNKLIITAFAGLLFFGLLLTGCGQKGDLYLPSDEEKMERDGR